MIELVFLFPIIAAALCLFLRHRPRAAEVVAICGALLAVAALLFFAFFGSAGGQPISGFSGIFYLDDLGMLFTAVTAVIGFFAIVYSRGYMRQEVKEGIFGEERIARYYALLLVFLASMLVVSLAADLLVTWAAVEATTLASVFLISFYNKRESVEAAWKYFIICSLGITLALVGLLILGYGLQQAGLPASFAWKDIVANAAGINPLYLKIAFSFIIVGYGTKVGLVPLHVWLPDAHGQAPTPVSALLSGVLMNAALYAILRLYPVAHQSAEAGAFVSSLFIFFGAISLALASLRLYSQENYKRLLAYSSIENMGIISLAIGIGGPLGIFAALFHMVSHSIVKPLAFFMGGIISTIYGTKEISKIGGVAQVMPALGQVFVLVNIGIAGSIPFGTFISEIALLAAALASGNFAVAAIVVIFTTIAFGSFLLKASQMAFGPITGTVHDYRPDMLTNACVWGLFLLAIICGLLAPQALIGMVNSAAAVLLGGG